MQVHIIVPYKTENNLVEAAHTWFDGSAPQATIYCSTIIKELGLGRKLFRFVPFGFQFSE